MVYMKLSNKNLILGLKGHHRWKEYVGIYFSFSIQGHGVANN